MPLQEKNIYENEQKQNKTKKKLKYDAVYIFQVWGMDFEIFG